MESEVINMFLVEAMFRNPPVEHEPWEAEYYRQKFQKLIKNPKFLLCLLYTSDAADE